MKPAILLLTVLLPLSARAATLSNRIVSAEFDERGLTSFAGFHFSKDGFSVTMDGRMLDSERMALPRLIQEGQAIRYSYPAGEFQLEVVYELRPGWKFLSKQLKINLPMGKQARINRIGVWRSSVAEPVRELYPCRDWGGFLRFDNARGLLALVQNPFLDFARRATSSPSRYKPDMDWQAA